MRLKKFPGIALLLLLLVIDANAADYIWVGKKQAKFNDVSAWSDPGGNAKSIPGQGDNIIFKSGTNSVILIEGNISLNNIVVEENTKVTFVTGSASVIALEGSFNASDRLRLKGKFDLLFNTRSNNSIFKSSGTQFTGNIDFNGKESLTLIDDIQTEGNIVLHNQELIVQ